MADLSPELASRVQSLESSYGDNPGRYFVALAGAWREGGDVARAEEILRENLKRFPGLSAHVLLGRCLADRGAFQEAANEFHYVLSIDSQNLIALRTLAEMAAAGGRRAEAERWYNELLAVDPMNVEARAALQQLARAPSAPAEPAGPAWGDVEPASLPGGGAGDGGEFGMIDLSEPDASPADASGVAADDDAGMGEWGDLALDGDEAPAAPAAAEAGDFDAFGFGSVDLDADARTAPSAAAPESSGGWMDLDARQDVGESAAEDAGGLPLLDDDMIDAPLAGADLPLLDLDDAADDDARVSPVSEPGAGFGFGEPVSGTFDDVSYVAHQEDGHDREAEMVTETMAELYASQGLHAQAADVYRELIRQRGEEPGLVRRLAEIQEQTQVAGSPGYSATETPSFELDADGGTPDWLESVDAFARGGTEPVLDAGVPGQDLSPAQTDETLAAEESADAADDGFPSFASTADDLPTFDTAAGDEFASFEPAGGDFPALDLTPADDLALSPGYAGSTDFASQTGFAPSAGVAPEMAGVASSTSADPFADSFAGGFDGAAEPAAAGDDRQAWEAPSVAESEPVGFDILVVEDEDGNETPAPSDVVADMSADWAMAAAPLDDDEEAAEAELAASASASTPELDSDWASDSATAAGVPAFTAPPVAAPGSAGGRTMGGYFASLLAWTPAPAEAPTYEVTADADGAIIIQAAAPDAPAEPATAALPSVDAAPAEPMEFESPAASFDAPASFPAAPGIPTFDAPAFQPPPAFSEPSAETPADAEPWAAVPTPADDQPWAAPGESAPEAVSAGDDEPWAAGGESAPAPQDLPLLDLDEPWAEAAPRDPVDIGAFELADDDASAEPASPAAAEAEELLPWEMPADPASAAPEPAAETNAGGFSFEDFFAGAPAEPAPPAAAPQPAPAPPAEAAPAYIPSFAEPTPPPVFEAPAPPAAFAAPAPPPAAPAAPAAGAQDEEYEDLESFQAWLQSLKR
jgi:tetratricopeptide (TPR) repeat protein